MTHAKPLPAYLIRRYLGWKATDFAENKVWYARLAEEGQRPRAMVISCCDSRVHVTSIFGAETGEFFIHRNIANIVPSYAPDDGHHGTSAAIEFAVTALKVAHVIVIGHSVCGGVKHFQDICTGKAETRDTAFIGNWISTLAPAWDQIKAAGKEDDIHALERQAVVVSLDNLMGFPFVREAVDAGTLTLHGLWHDIRDGELQAYDSAEGAFGPIG